VASGGIASLSEPTTGLREVRCVLESLRQPFGLVHGHLPSSRSVILSLSKESAFWGVRKDEPGPLNSLAGTIHTRVLFGKRLINDTVSGVILRIIWHRILRAIWHKKPF
jgi:hypothetical protein